MRRRVYSVLAGLTLLGGVAARAECRLDRVASLPVTEAGSKLRVAASINGVPANFVFDTGSQTTLITEAAAARFGLRAIAPEHGFGARGAVYGIGGTRRARPMEARTVDLGGLLARNFAFLVGDLTMASDGLLSSDLIAKYDIDLDVPGRRVRLFYPRGDCSHPSAFLHGTLYAAPLLANSRDRGPRVEVVVNGVRLKALVDTGAGSTALFRHAAERLGIDTARAFAQSRLRGGGIGPDRVQVGEATLANVAIGELALDRLPARILDNASLPDADMLLGADFLAAVHVWISNSSATLIMQAPAAPSPAAGAE